MALFRNLFTLAAAWLAAIAAPSTAASADTFPTRPISLFVPFAPGGVTDQVARTVAQKMQEDLGKPVIVENRPGGGGQLAAAAVKRNPADGYSLFVGATEMFAINPTLFKTFSYDPLQDFEPVAPLVSSSLVLIVPKSSPADSVKSLVAHAKTEGRATFASQGIGSIGHLLGEQFRTATGTELIHVAYKGSAPALQNVMGGQVDMMFDPVITVAPLIEADRVKPLAIAAAARSPSLPAVPTLAELGFPGIEAGVWFGMVARTGTPADISERLHQSVTKALSNPDVVKRLRDQGLEVMTMSKPEFGAFLRR